MNKFKTMLQRAWHAGGEALHQKPKRCLVALILCCAGVAHALAPAKDAATDRPNNPSFVESKTEGVTQNNEAIAALEKDLSERMNRLEERERQLYAQSLEASRKSIDWWFGGLAILTSLVAFLGAFLPWLMGRKDKELLQSELQNARDLVSDIKGHEKSAQQALAKIEEDKLKVASFQSGNEQSPADKEHTRDAAQKVNAEPSSSDSEKLRARAVLASQKYKPTAEEAYAAYELWFALTVLKPDDASAHFNAGYWAQQLFNKNAMPSEQYWFDLLSRHYQEGLNIKPSVSARYNWSLALLKQAKSATPSELNKRKEMASEAEKLLSKIAESSDKNKTGMAPLLAEAYVLLGYFEKCVQQLEICRQNESLPVPVSSVLLGLDGPDWTFDDHEVHWEPLGNSVEFKAWKQQYFTDPAPSSA